MTMTVLVTWKTALKLFSIASLISIGPLTDTHAAAAAAFDDFPMVIHCEYNGLHHAYYLSKVTSDGTATYITPGKLAGTISLTGTAKAMGQHIVGTCLGKTLAELRSAGQTYELKR